MSSFPISDQLKKKLREVLTEDLSSTGDLTSRSIFDDSDQSEARIVAKEEGIICGLPLIEVLFGVKGSVDQIEVSLKCHDGDSVSLEQTVATIKGPTIELLEVERTMLNFIQRLSGTATITNQFVSACDGKLKICDTRKTTPLWRELEKYAVTVGGGTNHRMGLYDMIMIKDTHADAVGGLAQAIERVRPQKGKVPIAVETRTLDEVKFALEAEVDLIMLDNMSKEMMQQAIQLIDGNIEVEITGNVTLEGISELSKLGADRVSIGALTHSVKALDLSMRTS